MTIDDLSGPIYAHDRKVMGKDADDLFELFSRIGCSEKNRFAMQFQCGQCCKKVSNIAGFLGIPVKDGFVWVFAHPHECLLVETFCAGKMIEKQIATNIVVPFSHFCSIGLVTKPGLLEDAEKASIPDIPKETGEIVPVFEGLPSFLAIAHKVCCRETRLAVQFDCGCCLKKASNIAKFFVVAGRGDNAIIRFLPHGDECMAVKVFCAGEPVETEVLEFLDVPAFRLCGVECGAVQL